MINSAIPINCCSCLDGFRKGSTHPACYCALRVSLRPGQLPAQDSAGRLLPKQDRQAWEVEEELEEALEEALEGVLFATPGRPAREDVDVGCWKSSAAGCWESSTAGCWKSSTVGCWKSSAAASLDFA